MSNPSSPQSSGHQFSRTDHTPSPVEMEKLLPIVEAYETLYQWLVSINFDEQEIQTAANEVKSKIVPVLDCHMPERGETAVKFLKPLNNAAIKKRVCRKCTHAILCYESNESAIGSRFRREIYAAKVKIEALKALLAVSIHVSKENLLKTILEQKLSQNCVNVSSNK